MNNKEDLKKWVIRGCGIALTLFVFYWLFKPQPVEVETVSVSKGPFVQSIEEDGKTRAKDIYKMISPIQGELIRIELEAGDSVEKNQVIATIVPSRSSLLDIRTKKILQAYLLSQVASVKKAEAFVERAKAAMDTAESDYKRNVSLAKKKYISDSELEQFILQLNLRKKEHDAAIAELNEMKQRVETVKSALAQFTQLQEGHDPEDVITLKAPLDSRVLSIVRKSAGLVSQGQVIMELADSHQLEIVADLLSEDVLQIPDNAKVIITGWGEDKPLKGHVHLVEPNAFTKVSALGVEEQRVNVIIYIDSPEQQWQNLGAGYGVDVEIIIYTQAEAVQVPISALFREGKQWAVFKLVSGRAQKQVIVIGRRNKEMALVLKGLHPGDQVINYPAEDVEDGVAVYVR